MCLTLLVRSIVKVISVEGEDQPRLFPLRAITLPVRSKHLHQRVINCVNEAHISLLIDFHFMGMSIAGLRLLPLVKQTCLAVTKHQNRIDFLLSDYILLRFMEVLFSTSW